MPDDLGHVLRQLGHDVVLLRTVLPRTAPDREVLAHAATHALILVTCNREDFIHLAGQQPHCGLIVLFRRKTRTEERVALVRLLAQAGELGVVNNINFA